ncbi:hypothetical protein ACH5RR_017091 [Cinchona calisaya]|uniref:MBD domain-containing protein n=1 Tax=Cinchona calisaya TaxID=153742 RepID=A0ABD3A0H1_9GENT
MGHQEKSSFDWLPAGWRVQVTVRKSGKKDKYYIDPVSGHHFRSMKEVSRYFDTGKMGRRSSKPKEQDLTNLESRHNSLSSFAETEEEKTADSKAEQSIGNKSLKSDTAAMNNVSLPKADKLAQREKKESSSESTSTVTEVPLENLHTGNGLEATKSKKRKLDDKKGVDLPRRTSKRLAGIEVNLSLEPNTRVCRTAGRQITETDVNCDDKDKNLANTDEHVKRVKTGNKADKMQESLVVLPPGHVTSPEEHAKEGIAEFKVDKKPGVPVDLSFTDLWNDPCIEFAIKTLTGAMPIGDEKKVDVNQGSYSNLPDAVPGSCLDLPSKDVWSDPCFEFAVKMLTGEIDATMDTTLQQASHNSSEIIGHNGLTLSRFKSGLAGYSHACVSSRHPNVAETPVHKQQL